MVDVTLPDGKSMYVPQGAAADAATHVAFHSEAQAEVNKLWLPAAETAAFMLAPEAVMVVVKDMPYARAVVCALAMCGAAGTSGGAAEVFNAEMKVMKEAATTRRRIERIPGPSKVNGDPP